MDSGDLDEDTAEAHEKAEPVFAQRQAAREMIKRRPRGKDLLDHEDQEWRKSRDPEEDSEPEKFTIGNKRRAAHVALEAGG